MEKQEHHLHLVLPKVAKDALDSLKEATSASSMTEVIRDALAVYHHLVSAEKRGEKVLVESEEGKQQVLVLKPRYN